MRHSAQFQKSALATAIAIGALCASTWQAEAGPYVQTNLVSDGFLPAELTDPTLVNPWGVSESATSPLWISNQAAGVATLYTLNGLSATRAGGPLVVPIPAPGPTGQVNNNTTSFVITQTGTPLRLTSSLPI